MFLTLCSPNWPNFIAWLLSRFEIFSNLCIVIISFLVYDHEFWNFLSSRFPVWLKKSVQKFKYLKNEKSF